MQRSFMPLSHDLESSAWDLSQKRLPTGTVGLPSISSEALCKPMRESLLPWQSRPENGKWWSAPGSCQVLSCMVDVFFSNPELWRGLWWCCWSGWFVSGRYIATTSSHIIWGPWNHQQSLQIYGGNMGIFHVAVFSKSKLRWGSYEQVSTCLHRAFGFGEEAVWDRDKRS